MLPSCNLLNLAYTHGPWNGEDIVSFICIRIQERSRAKLWRRWTPHTNALGTRTKRTTGRRKKRSENDRQQFYHDHILLLSARIEDLGKGFVVQ